MLPAEHYNICPQCGGPFINFCVKCAKQQREEAVEDLMEKYGMSLESLVADLADQIREGNFPALKLAIELRSMKPPTKTDITTGGLPISLDDETKRRILEKLNVVKRPGDSSATESSG